MKEILKTGAEAFGIELAEPQLEAFETYARELLSYNEKVNLTAITEPGEIALKHFVDSIAVASFYDIPEGAALIDVGTGAGFPGIPLKVLRPDLRLTLLDSLQKRLVFLELISERLGQKNKTVHLRAEQAGAQAKLRERFDVATSRAVASLRVLCEYCLPLVRAGGVMLALKGPDCAGEIDQAKHAVELLGGGAVKAIPYELPGGGGRTLVIIEKKSQTPTKYPRQRVKLTDKPL